MRLSDDNIYSGSSDEDNASSPPVITIINLFHTYEMYILVVNVPQNRAMINHNMIFIV